MNFFQLSFAWGKEPGLRQSRTPRNLATFSSIRTQYLRAGDIWSFHLRLLGLLPLPHVGQLQIKDKWAFPIIITPTKLIASTEIILFESSVCFNNYSPILVSISSGSIFCKILRMVDSEFQGRVPTDLLIPCCTLQGR